MNEKLHLNFERAWLNHVRSEEHFPRDMLFLNKDGKGRRYKAKTFDYLFEKTLQLFGKKHIYCSVLCDKCIKEGIISRVYMDFDSPKDLDLAYEDVKTVEKTFPSTIYFTAWGGFAQYISVEPLRLRRPRDSIRSFVEQLDFAFGFNSLDWHVIGDLQRVSRLPYTVNLKNNNLCIPISTDWSLDFILEQSKKCSVFLPVLFRPSAYARVLLSGFDSHIKEEKIDFEMPDLKNQERYREEVAQLLEIAPKIHDGRHRLIFHGIVPRLVLTGAMDEEIKAVCKEFVEKTGREWRDYEGYVERDIAHTRKRVANGQPLMYSFESLLIQNPDLIKWFRK